MALEPNTSTKAQQRPPPRLTIQAAGILSPLYGGLLLSRLGVASQPTVAAAHYAVLLALSAAVLARNAAAAAAAAAAREKKVV